MENTQNFPSAMESFYDGRYIKQTDAPNIPYHYFDLTDEYTKLLLHFIGVNLSTIITDSSSSEHTVTAYCDAAIKTDEYKFGTSSLYLDGTNDTIGVADSDDWFFDTGAFTFDTWVMFDGAPSTSFSFFDHHQSTSEYMKLYYDSVNLGLRFIVVTGGVTIADYFVEWVPVTLTWYHLALTRNLGNMSYFIDGVTGDWTGINTTITSSTSFPNYTAALYFGVEAGSGIIGLKGWLAELRISKGIARWSTGFVVPTTYYGYIKSSCLQADSYIALTETNAPSTLIGAASLYVKSSDGFLYYKDSAGAEVQITGAGSAGKYCYFYVAKAFALSTGAGPYTLPHTPQGDSGTDGDGNDYHLVKVTHSGVPQSPSKIASLVGDQLTLTFSPTEAFTVEFTW